MEISSIIGGLFSGLACRAYAAGFAMWMAYETSLALKPMAQVAAALN